ncbi:MAG: type pilus assembly ATPase PilB [Pseudomonadota bacterium]|jgi:type IV pilus assembly protein PilB
MTSARIVDIIKRSNLVTTSDLAKALEFSERDGVPLPLFLLKNKLVAEDALMAALSEGLGGMEVIAPDKVDIEQSVLASVPRDLVVQHRMVPISKVANNLTIAVGDPTNLGVFDSLSAKLGVKLRFKLASELAIQRAITRYYGAGEEAAKIAAQQKSIQQKAAAALANLSASSANESGESYVINYVERLMLVAAQKRASDIHIEPFEHNIRIRLRIDGSLIEFKPAARFEFRDALLSRVKLISGLDIFEKRLPQDGNAKLEIAGLGKMDFRVSSLPSVWGEKIVLRLLDKGNLQLDMTQLGFDTEQLAQFKDSIMKPFGMVIVTGPTGSGKTTTLYSALNELNRITDNVVTAEDPVEFTIPGICQVNVRPDIEFTFSKALKAFLRQDPDIIMVGEIRDLETGEIAMKAALTGHIVLSTLHTNNAAESIERLRNMGIDRFTIVSALNCVVAQRLVRKICEECKTEDSVSAEKQLALGLPEKYIGKFKIYKGIGCENCNNTGYRGRAAIYEVLVVNEPVKRAIVDNMTALDLKRIAMESGMQTLRQSAWKKVYKGLTTIDELIEASGSDDDAISASKRTEQMRSA